MSGKANLRCVGYKPVCRGTLRGFASIAFVDLHMVVHEIAIHEKTGRVGRSRRQDRGSRMAWPSKATTARSSIRRRSSNSPTPKVRWAWSDAVLRQVLAFDPRALECREAAAWRTERSGLISVLSLRRDCGGAPHPGHGFVRLRSVHHHRLAIDDCFEYLPRR